MEFDLIEVLRKALGQQREDVAQGIGDDAALLSPPPGHRLAVSIDTLVEGVHFGADTSPEDIGWKALAVNLSDLAAMGATPAWAVLALTLPAADRNFVARFAQGFAQLAGAHKLALVGGDLSRGPLSVSVCVHGFVPAERALLRSGAREGDHVFVTGTLGDAAAGLRCLDRNDESADALIAAPAGMREYLLERLRRPKPRISEGLALRDLAHACIDISDGLLADLGHLCKASGLGAEIELESVPRSQALRELLDGASALRCALSGGDDYELCFSAPPQRADDVVAALGRLGCGVAVIGRIVRRCGVRVMTRDGQEYHPRSRGWEHF